MAKKKELSIFDTLVKKYGEEVVKTGREVFEEMKDRVIIPVSPCLDYALGGGIQEGSWVQMIGDPKSGKTTTALQIAANAQKEEYGARDIWYVNVEGRLNRKNLEGIEGLDVDRINIFESPNETLSAEKYLGGIERIVKECPGSVIIIDSVSSMIAQKDLDEEVRGDYRPGLQKILSNFTKKMAGVVPKQKAIIIMITHYISNVSGYGKKKVADGGVKIQYQADTILEIARVQPWKVDDKADSQQIGQCVSWKVVTSSAGGFTGGGAISWLRYGTGLDKKQELFSQAVDFDMIEQAGAWYTCNFALENIEDVTDIVEANNVALDDTEALVKLFKFQGQARLLQFMDENPSLWDILDKTMREILY
jgi:recombination protein RecA